MPRAWEPSGLRICYGPGAEFGTTNETLSRTFAELRDQKLIFVIGRTITMPKPCELEELFKRNVGDI